MYNVFNTTKLKWYPKTLEWSNNIESIAVHCFILFVSLHFCPYHHHSKTTDTLKSRGGKNPLPVSASKGFLLPALQRDPVRAAGWSLLCAWFLDHCRCLANAEAELGAYIGHFNAVTHLLSVNKFTGTIVSVTHYRD